MSRDPHFLILIPVLAIMGIGGAASRGLIFMGFVVLLLFLAVVIAALRDLLPPASLLFAGEPLCLLSGPDLLLILVAHLVLLGLFLAGSGALSGSLGWGAFIATTLLALPSTILLPLVSPLLGILIPFTLAMGCGAGAFLGILRLKAHSIRGAP